MLHYSRYNREVHLPDGNMAIYNLVTGQKLKLNAFMLGIYRGILEAPDSKMAIKWKKQGFLSEGDEVTKLKLLHWIAASNTRHLVLTICPTRACNFQCPYCFEEHLNGSMSDEVQEKLINFAANFIKKARPERLSVAWFGGEPLLRPDIIEHLSEKFIELCDENDVKYSARIITNGYFFNQKNIDMLEDSKVDFAQITLDGPKEQNDETRILADGSGTYDVIMGNLKTIKTNMRISIRCNTNADNRAKYRELEGIIEALKEETDNDISVYPAYMDPEITADKSKLSKKSMDFDDFLENEYGNVHIKSLKDVKYRPTFCTVQNVCTFVVREDGTICKCWNDVTIPERTVADLLRDDDPLTAQIDSEWGQKYLGMDIYENEECRECQFLPVCGGGCPHKRIYGDPDCFKSLDKRMDELIIESFDVDNN